MDDTLTRPIQASISLSALRHNYWVAKRVAARAKVFAVVKANAYGHGSDRVGRALPQADGFATVELDSAVALRERTQAPILLLEGFFEASELRLIASAGLATVVHCDDQLRMLEAARPERLLDVWLKVNTGMNRLGFAPADVPRVCARLEALPAGVEIRLMTHFARADDDDGIAEPLARFERECAGLSYPRSLANSAGVVRFGEIGGDVVRPGIMLYGATPFAHRSAAVLGLEPAMTLRSQIIAIQSLAGGDSVGYGASFRAPHAMRIGVIACGYADGYPRIAPNGTPVLVCGKRVPMAGRVSMDMVTVDLAAVPEARVGSDVVLWGEGLPVDEVAAMASTVGYELLCAVAPRVPFVVRESRGG